MKRLKSAPSGDRRAIFRAGIALAAGLGLVSATAGTAHAVPVRLDYPLTGTTFLEGTGSSLTLGPGVLEAQTDLKVGTLTANTKLPPAPGSFKMIGAIPVSVTTEFIETEPTTGTIDLKTGAIKSTTKLTLRLKNLKVAGIPTPVGNACQTEVPAVLNLASEPGFNPLRGGKLSGTYTIPRFKHCLLATPLINLVIPGEGNTITLTLGQAAQPPKP
ncbi:hypothetical protein OG883_14760 [Streptomyces sp. NBC_01142]|uniref:hypothetical protein n=1 Tax=Streptomyces sp. NBC_01142 TaxID=2975865 RepID=UPI002252CA1E|nr:hypothetical protein [Streptomyces sp. NBC_01142]MCX4821152.1 hypothetical protein [Streptomyces sp. NBC_01142]